MTELSDVLYSWNSLKVSHENVTRRIQRNHWKRCVLTIARNKSYASLLLRVKLNLIEHSKWRYNAKKTFTKSRACGKWSRNKCEVKSIVRNGKLYVIANTKLWEFPLCVIYIYIYIRFWKDSHSNIILDNSVCMTFLYSFTFVFVFVYFPSHLFIVFFSWFKWAHII